MVMIQLPRTTIRLDERLHPSTPSALLSWVSVTQATHCPREGKASLLVIGFFSVKLSLYWTRWPLQKMKQYICLKTFLNIAQRISQNERKAMTIAGWAGFPREECDL